MSRRWGQAFDKQNKSAEAALRANGHKFAQPNQTLLDNIRKVRTGNAGMHQNVPLEPVTIIKAECL